MIGLPDAITVCLFDLDGVLTGTATLHREAWKATFDEFLRARLGHEFRPFSEHDYAAYVDGLPRADGVRRFLDSRSIELPEGESADPPDAATVYGIGNRKNELVLRLISERGVKPFPGSLAYLHAAQRAGLLIGVVTSSANAASVLDAAEITPYVSARIDGIVVRERGLRGKPEPDSFLAGAHELGAAPSNTAVFEDALAGVRAGKAGGFGFVVGVNRADQAELLRRDGADIVVDDLAELLSADTTQERP